MQRIPDFLENWLKDFSAAVRRRDYVSGKNLFAGGADSFGTVCARAENLEELIARQWRQVWPKTKDFDFEYDAARAVVTDKLVTIFTGWRSTGFDPDQNPVERCGRATIVLQRSAAGWQAVHTHFSINPHHDHDPVFRHARPR
jgi:ketosteroid isomerase-like protein